MNSSLGSSPYRGRHHHPRVHPPSASSSSATTSPDPTFSSSSIAGGSSASYTSASSFTPSTTPDTIAASHCTPSTANEAQADIYRAEAAASSSSTTLRRRAQPSYRTDAVATPSESSASESHFDSLHELLERAGYKETRIVTPDRQSLAGMFAKKLATPPRKPRLVDDFSSDSPSLAACELRRAFEKGTASRSTPKASTSKSLPSRSYKLPAQANAAPLPDAAASSSSWFPNLWFFGPGTIPTESTRAADPLAAPAGSSEQNVTRQFEPVSSTKAPESESAAETASAPIASTSAAPPKTNRTASNNPVWTASVAYRSAKSRTAPVRKNAAVSAQLADGDQAAEEAWKALQNGASNSNAKRRPGLVDAFSSPTKKASSSTPSHNSPSRQRKWRQERAAWRESLGDLQAMMDQSRTRREAAAAAAAAKAQVGTAEVVESNDDSAGTEAVQHHSSSNVVAAEEPSAHLATQSDDDAVAKLLSGPALPFLSTDPAVAPRNASCTTPSHLSMRRMKSVEVLSKIMRERRTISATASSTSPAQLASETSQSSIEIDTEAGQISPTIKKRSTPPRLTVTSPRGISSPKELALEGQEFEPMSWSPGKSGSVIISNRRVQKKPRSKLRHVSSGSDLRSAAAKDAQGELKMPSRRGRCTRVKTSPETSPEARGPVAALIRDSVGTLSRGSKVRALRKNVHVFDDPDGQSGLEGGVDDSPTRQRSRSQPERKVLALSNTHNTTEDDIFRPTGTLKKKDFSARITRTSKIMRLIEEAENIPSIASMIQPQPSSVAKPARRSTDSTGLSSSLSRKSRDRMHTITRVLGERQVAS